MWPGPMAFALTWCGDLVLPGPRRWRPVRCVQEAAAEGGSLPGGFLLVVGAVQRGMGPVFPRSTCSQRPMGEFPGHGQLARHAPRRERVPRWATALPGPAGWASTAHARRWGWSLCAPPGPGRAWEAGRPRSFS